MLDVESGSIFEIDELTEKLIKDMSPLAAAKGDFSSCAIKESADNKAKGDFSSCGKRPVDIKGTDFADIEKTIEKTEDYSDYSADEIAEAKVEIDELIREGVLYTSPRKHGEPRRSGTVKALCLNIAHTCNLRCSYCFAGDGEYSSSGLMDEHTAHRAIDFLIEHSGSRNNLEVDFFGGEPLLNMPIVKSTVEYGRQKAKMAGKNLRFTITTNALNLNADLIDYFNENMHNVVLSIDGRKNVHDALRRDKGGNGSFDRVLSNIKQFTEKRGDKSYYVRGTFTANNLDFSKDVLALNEFGFSEISLEPVTLDFDNPLALKEEHLPRLCSEYEELARQYLDIRREGKAFNFFHFNLNIYNSPCMEKRLVGCSAGDEYLAISPDGSIYPCHRFDGIEDYKIGNVNDGSFNEELPNKFACTNLTKKNDCPACWAKYYCSGGCAANSIFFAGDILLPHKVSCELMKKRVECALAIASIEYI